MLTDRESDRRDLEEGRGREFPSDPGVAYLVVVLSSGNSTVAQTMYRCGIVDVTNPEEEGSDLITDYEDTNFNDLHILVANISNQRPPIGVETIYAVATRVDDRYVMEYYGNQS